MAKRFELILDTSRLKFTASNDPSEKVDEHGVQRLDKETKLPLFSVGVVAWYDGGAEVLNVTVAGQKPSVIAGQPVSITGLKAVPWIRGTTVNVAYRAEKVTATAAGKA